MNQLTRLLSLGVLEILTCFGLCLEQRAAKKGLTFPFVGVFLLSE
jgi:hypothetical protein